MFFSAFSVHFFSKRCLLSCSKWRKKSQGWIKYEQIGYGKTICVINYCSGDLNLICIKNKRNKIVSMTWLESAFSSEFTHLSKYLSSNCGKIRKFLISCSVVYLPNREEIWYVYQLIKCLLRFCILCSLKVWKWLCEGFISVNNILCNWKSIFSLQLLIITWKFASQINFKRETFFTSAQWICIAIWK